MYSFLILPVLSRIQASDRPQHSEPLPSAMLKYQDRHDELLVHRSLAASSSKLTCSSQNEFDENDFQNVTAFVCKDVVDYSYYIPPSLSSSSLHTLASEILSSPLLTILPSKCRYALQRAVCSNVYLRCHSSSSQTSIYRPCGFLCDRVASDCWGLLSVFKFNDYMDRVANCSGYSNYSSVGVPVLSSVKSITGHGVKRTYDYSYASLTNYSSTCNGLSANVSYSTSPVASAMETYKYGDTEGACSGITTRLYVPPGNVFNSSLSPIQRTHAVQELVEAKLLGIFDTIPAWVSKSCYFAIRKYFCGVHMPHPQQMSLAEVLRANGVSEGAFHAAYGNSISTSSSSAVTDIDIDDVLSYAFYLPSYPGASVCEEYVRECGQIADISGLEIFQPHCSANTTVYGTTFDLFPSANQTVLNLDLIGPLNQSSIAIDTSPRAMHGAFDTARSFVSQCPYGFVVPDDIMDPRNRWYKGTGCAKACRCVLNVFL